MYSSLRKYGVIIMLLLLAFACKKPFLPAVLVKGDNYLVVDGFINVSGNGQTNIVLSRTKNLTDTVVSIPENSARVNILNAAGANYALQEVGNGVYTIGSAQLPGNTQYKLAIITADGKRYESDLVAVKPSPAIDSVSWVQDTAGVHVFANTHDPSNTTRYYRWQYVLTWEYHSQLETPWGLTNNVIFVRDISDLIHICYQTTLSTDVLLGSSAALSQDVISMAPLFDLPPNDSMIAYRMSIQLKQYALTPQAYSYWQIIRKNSQELGTLFDLQPSQLEGNIHCIDNPSEPVVGFISAGTEAEKRIFIKKDDLQDWVVVPGSYNCVSKIIDQDPNDFSRWTFADPTYAPWYFAPGAIIIAKKECLDCRLSGGTTTKPSFW